MEVRGQAELEVAEQLPVETHNQDAEFLALGFAFGEPSTSDRLFRHATLPAGWRRVTSDGHRSHIADLLGRQRVAIFGAASHDHAAHMSLIPPEQYVRECVDGGRDPALDDTWLTPTVAVVALAGMREDALNRARDGDEIGARRGDSTGYWHAKAQEDRGKAAKAEALRVRIAAGGGAR